MNSISNKILIYGSSLINLIVSCCLINSFKNNDLYIDSFIFKFIIFTVYILINVLWYYYLIRINNIQITNSVKSLFAYGDKKNLINFKNLIKNEFRNDYKLLEKAYYITGTNILIYAVSKNNYPLVELLLSKGFDVNCRDIKNGETALIRAIHYNFYDIVELLIKHNTKFDISSYELNISPINIAIMRNKHKIVDLLMMNGVDFSYNEYTNSNANYYNNWENVKIEVKQVIYKHKSKNNIYNLLILYISF